MPPSTPHARRLAGVQGKPASPSSPEPLPGGWDAPVRVKGSLRSMGGPVSSPFGLRAAPAPPSPLTRPSAERGAQRQTWGVEVRQGQGRARRPQRSAGAAATSTERVRTRAKRSLTLTGLLAASGEGAGTRAKPARPAREPPGGEGGVSRGAAPLWARPKAAQSSKTKKLHRACPVADPIFRAFLRRSRRNN